MKHSPEPWKTEGELPDRFGKDPSIVAGIFDADGYLVADSVIGRGYCENADLIADDNMKRIVACVNFCRGLPTQFLEEHMAYELAKPDAEG